MNESPNRSVVNKRKAVGEIKNTLTTTKNKYWKAEQATIDGGRGFWDGVVRLPKLDMNVARQLSRVVHAELRSSRGHV